MCSFRDKNISYYTRIFYSHDKRSIVLKVLSFVYLYTHWHAAHRMSPKSMRTLYVSVFKFKSRETIKGYPGADWPIGKSGIFPMGWFL